MNTHKSPGITQSLASFHLLCFYVCFFSYFVPADKKKKRKKKMPKPKPDGWVISRQNGKFNSYKLTSDGLQLFDKEFKNMDTPEQVLPFSQWKFKKDESQKGFKGNFIAESIASSSITKGFSISTIKRGVPFNADTLRDGIIMKDTEYRSANTIQDTFVFDLEWFILAMIIMCCLLCVCSIFGLFGCIGGYFIASFQQQYEVKYVPVEQDIV